MMNGSRIESLYFEWLSDIVCPDNASKKRAFYDLLCFLQDTPFRYSIANDKNRVGDAIALRMLFLDINHIDPQHHSVISFEASVLEVLISLAKRCEEDIMDDLGFGNRTEKWFWVMLENLELDYMSNKKFNMVIAKRRIDVFLDRRYDMNGKGGAFILQKCSKNMREVELWYQLNWYLGEKLYP